MRESVAKAHRSRKVVFAAAVIFLLACVAGVLGYCYVGPISVEEQDLVSATVVVHMVGDRFSADPRTIDLDLADPAMRGEVAGLLNGLHRWHGEASEGVPYAYLEVRLGDGSKYYVTWWLNDDLELTVDRGEPDRDTHSVWVRSGQMKKFLTRYFEP